MNRDLSPKPSYEALQELLHREWHTELSGVSDGDGCVRFRGFHGSYIAQTGPGIESTFTLEPQESAATLIVGKDGYF